MNTATVMRKGVGGSENAKPGSSGVGIDSSVRLRSIKIVCRDMLRRSLKTGDNTAALVFRLSNAVAFRREYSITLNRSYATVHRQLVLVRQK